MSESREPAAELAAREADELAAAVTKEIRDQFSLGREHRHSRWHDGKPSATHRESWACIPLVDAVYAVEAAAHRAALRAAPDPFLTGVTGQHEAEAALAQDRAALAVPGDEALRTAERLAETATDYLEAVTDYLNPENQYTESRLHHVNTAKVALREALGWDTALSATTETTDHG